MAIWGIGAMYGKKDVTIDFINNKVACLGWSKEEAPSLYEMIKNVNVGDIIYIKSFSPNVGLKVKAIGIVLDSEIKMISDSLGFGIKVNWLCNLNEHLTIHFNETIYRNNVYNNSLYEEFNVIIRNAILEELFKK